MKVIIILSLCLIIIVMLYYNTKLIEGAPELPSGNSQASVNNMKDMRTFLEQMYMVCLLNPNDTSSERVWNTSCYKTGILSTYLWPVLGPFSSWSLEELSPIFGVPTGPISLTQATAEQSNTEPKPIPIITNDEDYQLFLQLAILGNLIRSFGTAELDGLNSTVLWFKDNKGRTRDACREKWKGYQSSLYLMNDYYKQIVYILAHFHAQANPTNKISYGDSKYTELYDYEGGDELDLEAGPKEEQEE